MRRVEGRSVREIAKLLSVSRPPVSLWVRDIELTEEQHAVLQSENALHERQRLATAALMAKARARRKNWQLEGRRRAATADPLYVAGCMLYWAEGDKDRHSVRISNSDPAVLRHFVRFLRVHFDVCDDQLRISCNLFADHEERQREIEDFWLSTVALPRACLRKSVVNRYSRYTKKKRTNKLPYGTCKLIVHSTQIVQTIYGSIQALGRFDRPEWIDMP